MSNVDGTNHFFLLHDFDYEVNAVRFILMILVHQFLVYDNYEYLHVLLLYGRENGRKLSKTFFLSSEFNFY